MKAKAEYSNATLVLEYEDMPEDTDEQYVFETVDEIVETFLTHLTDRLNARLPGKWLAREQH